MVSVEAGPIGRRSASLSETTAPLEEPMHSLILVASFALMFFAPCVVCMGGEASDPVHEDDSASRGAGR